VEIFEGDIIQPLPVSKYDAFTVLFHEDGHGFYLSASADYEVVGHNYMK
jgi:hypothetical protein